MKTDEKGKTLETNCEISAKETPKNKQTTRHSALENWLTIRGSGHLLLGHQIDPFLDERGNMKQVLFKISVEPYPKTSPKATE